MTEKVFLKTAFNPNQSINQHDEGSPFPHITYEAANDFENINIKKYATLEKWTTLFFVEQNIL